MEFLLGILPAFLLVLALLCGRYPGERVILRLASRGRRQRLRERPAPRPTWLRMPEGRDRIVLLATSRSLRGPPALSV